jgi:ADP-heptose:LPS heptosyltransferase
LKTDLKRNDVLNYFKRIAFSKNETNETENLLIELKNNPDQKRIAFIQPESNEEVIIASALISSIKKIYPKHKIYFFTKPEYFDLINSNPHIEKILQYNNKMDDPLYFEGKGDQIKYFDIVYAPYLSIRNNFTRNCEDKIQFDIYESN